MDVCKDMKRLLSIWIALGLMVAGAVWAQTQPAAPFQTPAVPGVSGPGNPLADRSPVYALQIQPNGTAIANGLLAPFKPLLDLRLRHTSITLAPDRFYYMTGTGGENALDHNDGIELWRSPDLVKWEYLGLIWSIENDGTWQKEWRVHYNHPVRTIWAPRLQYIKGNFYISYCMPPGDRGLLKSTSGKPQGPYVNAIAGDGKFPIEMYASLFQDDDDKVYLVYDGGWIGLLNDDLSGMVGVPRKPALSDPDQDPTHHNASCALRRDCLDIGNENAFLFKRDGKYYLSVADTYEGRYSSMVAISDTIYGPYHTRHEAVPCGGGGTYFRDKAGRWWETFWGNDPQAPWTEMPGIIRLAFNADGTIHPAK